MYEAGLFHAIEIEKTLKMKKMLLVAVFFRFTS